MSGIRKDKLMAYIVFFLSMTGFAAVGGAIDMGTGLVAAVSMTVVGAALMWFFREEGKSEDEEEDNGVASCCGSHVDKPAGEGAGGL